MAPNRIDARLDCEIVSELQRLRRIFRKSPCDEDLMSKLEMKAKHEYWDRVARDLRHMAKMHRVSMSTVCDVVLGKSAGAAVELQDAIDAYMAQSDICVECGEHGTLRISHRDAVSLVSTIYMRRKRR